MRARVALAALLASVAGACSAGGGAPAPSTSSAPASTAAPAPRTTAPRPPPTTVGIEVAPQPSPDAAAAALLDAWRRGDRTTALRVASLEAVNALFARPGSATEARGCQDPVAGASDCAFGTGGTNLLTLHTVAVPSGLWVVATIAFES